MRLYSLFAVALATSNAVDVRDEAAAQLAAHEDTQVQETANVSMAALDEAMNTLIE